MLDLLLLLAKIVVGNLMIAFSVNAFIRPFSFVSTGSTGLALLLDHYFHIPFSPVVATVMITCFLLGLFFLGKKFAMTTVISSLVYPVFIQMTQFVSELQLVSDALIAALLAAVVMGAGIGIIIQAGASSGGMDIPPLIMQHYFHIPVSVGMWCIDLLIMLAQVPYSNFLQIFCGLTMSTVCAICMNRILAFGKTAVQILVITGKPEQVRDCLLKRQRKGVTLFEVETGYRQNAGRAVCSVFPQKDLAAVRSAIYAIDPDAFMIVSSVQEVRGMNFKGWNQKALMDLMFKGNTGQN